VASLDLIAGTGLHRTGVAWRSVALIKGVFVPIVSVVSFVVKSWTVEAVRACIPDSKFAATAHPSWA
jgi:hypothetical protein